MQLKKDCCLEDSLGYIISAAHKSLAGRLGQNLAAANVGITFEQWALMVRLWHKDGISQQELANMCCKDKTTITRVIDNLENQNLVIRVEDKLDRRNKLIYLTSLGKKYKDLTMPIAEVTIKEATLDITSEDLETCKKVLDKIRANLK